MGNLLLATQNPGKLRELRALLAPLVDQTGAQLVAPGDLGLSLEVEETGATYAENATLKAVALARASGLVALGDDSGLEVAALNGAPGLYSARYAGLEAGDAERRKKLLHELSQVPTPRQARFVCVVAVAAPGPHGPDTAVRLFEGECRGEIALAESGRGGFGYDPVFFVPEYGATTAALPQDVKNTISHRARAVQAALPYLIEILEKP